MSVVTRKHTNNWHNLLFEYIWNFQAPSGSGASGIAGTNWYNIH